MRFSWKPWGVSPMRDLSGTGQVYRFTLSQLLKSRANRVTLIIMVLLAAVSMPLTALLGGETPETSDTAGLTSVRVDNRTDLVLDFSGDAYWADTDFSADAGEPDAVVTITGDETGYQVAVNGGETADAGELSQLAETARQAVRDACLQAAGLSSRQLEALTASTGEEDSHEEGFWVQYGYSILAMILCLMSASYVIRAVVEEKDSRLVELLLVSVKPMALLAGKILAVMAFTFGWLLAMLAGLGVSCGLTAGLMGPGVLQKQLSGLLAAVPRVQEDLWQAAGVLLVLLVSNLVIFILHGIKPRTHRGGSVLSLLSSLVKYVAGIIIVCQSLSLLGVNVGTIIASVGVLALVVGFSAESLIADVVIGAFMLLENQYNVGDIVEVNGFRGVVTKIGIRTTSITDGGGNVKIINNSEMKNILNRSDNNSWSVSDISIPYETDLEKLEAQLPALLEEIFRARGDVMLDTPQYLGVQTLDASGIVLRFWVKVAEKNIYAGARALNRELLLGFRRLGVECPFPQMDVHMK